MRDTNEIFSPNHLSLTESISNHVMLMIFLTNFLSGFFQVGHFWLSEHGFKIHLVQRLLYCSGKCGPGMFPHVP